MLLKKIVLVTALTFFLLQMIAALRKYFDPQVVSSPGLKLLKSLDRPVLVSLCKNSQFDYAHAQELAYNSATGFLTGTVGNDDLSWSGPTGTQSFQELLDTLFTSSTENVRFHRNDNDTVTKFLLPVGVCKILQVYPTSKQDVEIGVEDGLYTITVSDPAYSSNFQLSDHLMTGDKILSKPESTEGIKIFSDYRIQLTETIKDTKDGSCTIYPNENHHSFHDCVTQEMEEKVMPVLSCMIPWMSPNNQCTGFIRKLPAHQDLHSWLGAFIRSAWKLQGHLSDDCLPPCSILSAHSTFLRSYTRTTLTHDVVCLYFDVQVRLERRLQIYGFENLLVEIGSSLGLWLGISVLGIFGILARIASSCVKMKEFTRNMTTDKSANTIKVKSINEVSIK